MLSLPSLHRSDNDLLYISNIQTWPAEKCVIYKSCSLIFLLLCAFYDKIYLFTESQSSKKKRLCSTKWTNLMDSHDVDVEEELLDESVVTNRVPAKSIFWLILLANKWGFFMARKMFLWLLLIIIRYISVFESNLDI